MSKVLPPDGHERCSLSPSLSRFLFRTQKQKEKRKKKEKMKEKEKKERGKIL